MSHTEQAADTTEVLQVVEIDRPRRSIDGERLVAIFSQIIEPLGRSLPASSEIVLHDLSLLPNSIVALHGDVTGRRVGGSATGMRITKRSDGSYDGVEAHEYVLPDGRRIRSTTVLIHDVSGNPVAALCINTDLSMWVSLQHLTEAMVSGLTAAVGAHAPIAAPQEGAIESPQHADSVETLSKHLIDTAIESVGVPVELMKKRHKILVVKDLKDQGLFLLRDGIDIVAHTLNVSRFTIYNYLNEIDSSEASAAAQPATSNHPAASD